MEEKIEPLETGVSRRSMLRKSAAVGTFVVAGGSATSGTAAAQSSVDCGTILTDESVSSLSPNRYSFRRRGTRVLELHVENSADSSTSILLRVRDPDNDQVGTAVLFGPGVSVTRTFDLEVSGVYTIEIITTQGLAQYTLAVGCRKNEGRGPAD